MNLRFLETFVWVARLKSFRLTAQKLFTTQASVSSRIAALEADLGVKLLLRDSRGVSLTPEGSKVLEHAERMLETAKALKQSLDSDRAKVGRIRLGVMDTVIHTWMSALVAELTERYRQVEIELVADTALNLREQLHKGFLDVIVQTDLLREPSIRSLDLARYPMGWVVAAGSHLHRDYASLAELGRERIITFSKNSRPHQEVLALLQGAGVQTPRLNCVNSVAAITRLLRDGFGIGALPPALVEVELNQGDLVLLAGLQPPPSLELVVAWQTGVALVDEVVGVCRQVLERYAQDVGGQRIVLVPGGM
ncbi:LysR family transcriptional regulator [Pseudomonas fulva]|uniref:LysR family transcriptional regulator n=1 Tax=Pseudomonas fulva TaxID=47880 RepID=UPI000CE96E0E|nr:LysR family transcriptional regulator [Pseudomonas fulva]AVF56459.1 LysR family transcriptional regulator [Pseudomonas fulva]